MQKARTKNPMVVLDFLHLAIFRQISWQERGRSGAVSTVFNEYNYTELVLRGLERGKNTIPDSYYTVGFHVHTNPQGASYCLLRPIWEPRDWSDWAGPCPREKLQLWITVKQHFHDWWVFPHHHICFKDPFCLLWRVWINHTHNGWLAFARRIQGPGVRRSFYFMWQCDWKMGKGCYLTPRPLRSTRTSTSSRSLQTFCHQTSQLMPGEGALPLISFAVWYYTHLSLYFRDHKLYLFHLVFLTEYIFSNRFFFSFFPTKSKRKPEPCIQ